MYLEVPNIKVAGIAAAVPSQVEKNSELPLLGDSDEREKFIATTGIYSRHIVGDSGLCSSDLCFAAAERLIEAMQWNREEIGFLVFVTQTPDYMLPATACILQERLGLPQSCCALDLSLGCSGWVYGLSVLSSLMAQVSSSKGLLLAGDTVSLTKSPHDRGTYPLFGDAGSATALLFEKGAEGLRFDLGTDGSNSDSIMIRDGGFRHFFSEESLRYTEVEPGVVRNSLQSCLNGPQVFTFAITKAPRSMRSLLEQANVEVGEIDYLLLHQANRMMLEKIRTKMKIDQANVPYCLDEYGNTSSASIPLTYVTRIGEEVNSQKRVLACGFGVGFSWGSLLFTADHVCCPPLVEVSNSVIE